MYALVRPVGQGRRDGAAAPSLGQPAPGCVDFLIDVRSIRDIRLIRGRSGTSITTFIRLHRNHGQPLRVAFPFRCAQDGTRYRTRRIRLESSTAFGGTGLKKLADIGAQSA